MIKIQCKDSDTYSAINRLLEQKNFINNLNKDKYYTVINIDINYNKLSLEINKKKVFLNLPIDTNLFFNEFLKLISDIKISINNFDYFPFKRVLLFGKKKSLLSDIQNTIFSNLLVSTGGLNKLILYNLIWKKDKNVSINKLDTHLTNLKNQLKKDLSISVNFQSHDKTLRLLIN